ncbi:MAG: hypothetical protein E6Q76_14750 [Rhizobium sp.]|nr:MAG: hypothetical protein E6Q76_14750 [Rhizobium sp.]
MPKRNDSPAVQSIMNERSEQRRQGDASELEKALEDTFPASDPVSTTHTAVVSGHVTAEANGESGANRHVDRFEDSLPVDTPRQKATEERREESRSADKRDVRGLYRAARLEGRPDDLSARGSLSSPEDRGILREIKHMIRERPIATVATAVVIGLAFGITR